jgi:hypothetical protein
MRPCSGRRARYRCVARRRRKYCVMVHEDIVFAYVAIGIILIFATVRLLRARRLEDAGNAGNGEPAWDGHGIQAQPISLRLKSIRQNCSDARILARPVDLARRKHLLLLEARDLIQRMAFFSAKQPGDRSKPDN